YLLPVAGANSCSGCAGVVQQRLEFAVFVHLGHDVRPADEFAADVKLGNGGPVGKFLDALANFFVFQHVDGDQLLHATRLQDLDGAPRTTTLRNVGGAFRGQRGGRL